MHLTVYVNEETQADISAFIKKGKISEWLRENLYLLKRRRLLNAMCEEAGVNATTIEYLERKARDMADHAAAADPLIVGWLAAMDQITSTARESGQKSMAFFPAMSNAVLRSIPAAVVEAAKKDLAGF